MTPIQYCPPQAAAGSEAEHQFARNPNCLNDDTSASFDANGDASAVGITYADMSAYGGNMQIERKRLFTSRRGGIPEWARSTALTRAVLVQYLEDRAFGRRLREKLPRATEATRLARAVDRIRNHRVPKMTVVLDRLCSHYVAEKQHGDDSARLRKLAEEIEGVDTFLRMAAENLPAILLSVIYHAYNLGENSVEIGKALQMKPPHCRQLLKRLNDTWKRMSGLQ
jgi:hypothetical protein